MKSVDFNDHMLAKCCKNILVVVNSALILTMRPYCKVLPENTFIVFINDWKSQFIGQNM